MAGLMRYFDRLLGEICPNIKVNDADVILQQRSDKVEVGFKVSHHCTSGRLKGKILITAIFEMPEDVDFDTSKQDSALAEMLKEMQTIEIGDRLDHKEMI